MNISEKEKRTFPESGKEEIFVESEMGFCAHCVFRVRNGLLEPMCLLSQKQVLQPRCFSVQKRALEASAQAGKEENDVSLVRNRLLGTMLFLSQKSGFRGKKEKMSFPDPETGSWS